MEAFITNLVIFPSLKYGLISFANTGHGASPTEEILQWHLIDDHLGIPQNERHNWTKQ